MRYLTFNDLRSKLGGRARSSVYLEVQAEMKCPPTSSPTSAFFGTATRRTLADVLVDCEAALTGTGLRDTRSAFRFLERQCGIELAETLARPQEIRKVFAGLSPARIGISEKRLANIGR